MALHNKFGADGEALAADWLEKNGYQVKHRNWRHSYYEIDIVATRNKMLHFIEVKCRHHSSMGYPEDSVTKRKFRNLKRAANRYLQLNPGHQWIQYDILSITFFKWREPEFFLLEDVFM